MKSSTMIHVRNASILAFNLVFVSFLLNTVSLKAQQSSVTTKPEKELYIPENTLRECGNMKLDTGEYSFKRMKQSDNLAVLWARKFGDDPMANPDTLLRFDPDYILKEGERIYNYYIDELKFLEKGNSISDKYKCLIYIVDSKDGTAYGGGEDNKIGAFWAPPSRIRKAPFGAMAHEMGHSFQYLLGIDRAANNNPGGVGSYAFVEMTSQFLLWQVYPTWITFENYHLVDFMKQTHLAFLHNKNMYHSPFVMEYWASLHGNTIISKIWQQAKNEDPVVAYKRLTNIDQKTFNDQIFDAARRFVTWDIPRIDAYSRKYANQHHTKLVKTEEPGWYVIAPEKCPQNYGYNAIKLQVPDKGNKVGLHFKGVAGAEGYSAVKVEKAGWRYGFLAVNADGSRVYSPMFVESESQVSFKVPKGTAHLWLVVSGAPTEHWLAGGRNSSEEQWPYRFKLTNTEPVPAANGL
jgi:hypothetical protein